MKPALITTAIFTFIWTWNDFFSQLIYLTDRIGTRCRWRCGPSSTPASRLHLGALLAMAVLSLVPIFLVFLIFQRYLITEGISTTGLKG